MSRMMMGSPRRKKKRYFGKFRGVVTQNEDPLMLGRVEVKVPAVSGMKAAFAMPCVPYAGPMVGMFLVPPVGANVWVEFEGGDPGKPILAGCFWGEGELPVGATEPFMKVLKTDTLAVVLTDTVGEGLLEVNIGFPGPGPEGVNIEMDDSTITILQEPNNIVLARETGFEIQTPALNLVADGEITETAGAALSLEAGGDMAVTSAGPMEVSGADLINVSAAVALKVNAPATDVTGVVAVQGDVNVAGAAEVEGATNILGILAVELETNIAGALTVEGETNIAGNLSVEGACEIIGAFIADGIPYPPIPI